MRRLVLILLVVVAVAGGFAWRNRTRLIEIARQEVQRELERASGQEAAVGALTVSLFPPRVRVEGIVIGGEEPLARLESLEVRLATLSTVAEARLVATVTAHSLFLDATRLPQSPDSDDEELIAPAFRIGGIRIDDLQIRFPIGDEVGLLSVAKVRGQVESSRIRRLVAATLSLKGSQLRRAKRTLDLGEIRLSGGLDAEGVTIQSASLKAPERTIELTGTSPTAHEFKGELDLHDLVIIDDDFDAFSGPGRISGKLVGLLEQPVLEGALEVTAVQVADRQLGVLTSRVHHQGETTRFEGARLHGLDGEVRGTIVAKFRDEIPIEGTLVWDVSNLEALLNKLDLELAFDNQLAATMIVKGQFDPLELDISAEGKVLADVEAARLKAEGRVAEDRTDIRFSLTQATRTRLSGHVGVRSGKLDGQVDLETTDLAAVSTIAPRVVGELDLSGEGTVSVRVGGTTDAPRFDGTVAAGPLSVARVDLDALQGSFGWTEEVLEIPSATLATRGGTATFAGVLALADDARNDWRLALTDVDTDLATGIARRFSGIPDLVQGGELTGVVTCAGRWSAPELSVSLVVDNPAVAGEAFARLEVEAERKAAGWRFSLDATHATDVGFRVTGAAKTGAPAQVSITATPVDLDQVGLAKRFGVKGVVNFEGQLTGDLAQADGAFELSAAGLSVGREDIGELRLRASGRKGRWRVEGGAPAKRLAIIATALAESPFSYTATLDWQDFAFDYEAAGTDHLNGTTTGSAEASGNLQDLGASKVSIRVPRLDLRWGDAKLRLKNPIILSGELGALRIQPFSMVGKETELSIVASVKEQTELAIVLDGEVSLDYLELLGDPFVSTDGTVALDLRLRRSPQFGWVADGTATVRRAALDLGLPVAFTDATATIIARGRHFEIERLSAKCGGGSVSLNGTVDIDRGPALSWRLGNVAVNPEPGIEAVVAGEGTADGTWSDLAVRGTLDVKRALYSRDFEIVDIPALLRPSVEAIAETAPATIVRLDLKTTGRGGLYVDNNVAQVELAVDGAVKGTLRDPKLIGTVSVVGGTVKVRRRSFTLTGGAVDFRGRIPPNPNVNINAETEISTREADYVVTATVSGTAQDPVVNFGSDDPSLTQGDIVSLVAVGRTAAELQGESGGVSSIDALALVPTAQVEEQVSQLVGIDRFEVDLAQTDSQGDLSPGVTIGKNLTDRFRAALSTTFTVDARNAVVLEYDLTRRISLIGQWEADTKSGAGAFGAGVRMRYEFRRLPFSLLRDVETRGDDGE